MLGCWPPPPAHSRSQALWIDRWAANLRVRRQPTRDPCEVTDMLRPLVSRARNRVSSKSYPFPYRAFCKVSRKTQEPPTTCPAWLADPLSRGPSRHTPLPISDRRDTKEFLLKQVSPQKHQRNLLRICLLSSAPYSNFSSQSHQVMVLV